MVDKLYNKLNTKLDTLRNTEYKQTQKHKEPITQTPISKCTVNTK
jgi:hypothetical protein